MDLVFMLLATAMWPTYYLWQCRIISMTFKTRSRSIIIKNDKLANMLIAEENSWGIATDLRKRNRMSLLGILSYMVFLPQIAFILYNWWIYMKTGSAQWCEAERSYQSIAILFYAIALSIKLKEARKFSKGEIW